MPGGKAPRFTEKPAIKQTAEGNLLMECQLEASPQPTIKWSHGADQISQGGRYQLKLDDKGKETYTASLLITVRKPDSTRMLTFTLFRLNSGPRSLGWRRLQVYRDQFYGRIKRQYQPQLCRYFPLVYHLFTNDPGCSITPARLWTFAFCFVLYVNFSFVLFSLGV